MSKIDSITATTAIAAVTIALTTSCSNGGGEQAMPADTHVDDPAPTYTEVVPSREFQAYSFDDLSAELLAPIYGLSEVEATNLYGQLQTYDPNRAETNFAFILDSKGSSRTPSVILVDQSHTDILTSEEIDKVFQAIQDVQDQFSLNEYYPIKVLISPSSVDRGLSIQLLCRPVNAIAVSIGESDMLPTEVIVAHEVVHFFQPLNQFPVLFKEGHARYLGEIYLFNDNTLTQRDLENFYRVTFTNGSSPFNEDWEGYPTGLFFKMLEEKGYNIFDVVEQMNAIEVETDPSNPLALLPQICPDHSKDLKKLVQVIPEFGQIWHEYNILLALNGYPDIQSALIPTISDDASTAPSSIQLELQNLASAFVEVEVADEASTLMISSGITGNVSILTTDQDGQLHVQGNISTQAGETLSLAPKGKGIITILFTSSDETLDLATDGSLISNTSIFTASITQGNSQED